MGSCSSSVQKVPDQSAINLDTGSKIDMLLIPSPVKDKPITENGGISIKVPNPELKSLRSRARTFTSSSDFGSKDDTFFDSQPWLESDCDDDFLSVKGEFTPSCGNTPVHSGFLARNLTGSRGRLSLRQSSSRTHKRKSLLELFKESMRNNQNLNMETAEDNQNGTSTRRVSTLAPKSTSGTPYASVTNSPSGELKSEVKRSSSAQCCLPRRKRSSLTGRDD